MFGKHTTDVLIVGAGPVGLFTALSLAERGIAIEIIDAQWRTAARSYALALHPGTLAVLDEAGLAGELVSHGYRLDKVAFYDGGERRAELELPRLESDFSFVLVLPQQALEDALERRLASLKTRVNWNNRMSRFEANDASCHAVVQRLGKETTGYSYAETGWVVEREIDTTAAYLVGADGHRSLVRRQLGLDFPDLGGARYFGVFELTADADLEHEARIVLDDDSTNVLWPLGDGRFRWSFELEPPELPPERVKGRLAVQLGTESLTALDETRLHELIAARAPWFEAEIHDVEWSLGIRFERRLASSFGHGRVWLAGDAAHLAPPLGVQSMNVGLREGRDLAARIATALGRGAAGDDDLEAYGRTYLDEWRRLLGLDGRVEVTARASEWVRKRAARIPAVVPASGADLQSLLGQLGLRLVND